MTSKLISCAIFYCLAFDGDGIGVIFGASYVDDHLWATSIQFRFGIRFQSAHLVKHFLELNPGRRVDSGVLHGTEQVVEVHSPQHTCKRLYLRRVFLYLKHLRRRQDGFIRLFRVDHFVNVTAHRLSVNTLADLGQ
jgi:hypothetical protein